MQTNLRSKATYALQLPTLGGTVLDDERNRVVQLVHDFLEAGDVDSIMALILPDRPDADKARTRSLLSNSKMRLSLLKVMSTHPAGEQSVTSYPGFLAECHASPKISKDRVAEAKFLGLSVSKNVEDQCNEMEAYKGVMIWFGYDQSSSTYQPSLGGVFLSVPNYLYCGRVKTDIDTVKLFLSNLKGSCREATTIFNSYLKKSINFGTVAPKSITVSGWSCNNVMGFGESPYGKLLHECKAGSRTNSPMNSTLQVVRPTDVILPITLRKMVGSWSTHAGYLKINPDGSGEMSFPLEDPVNFTNNFPTIKFLIQKILNGRARAIVKSSDEKTVPKGSLVWISRTEEGLKAVLASGHVEVFCDVKNRLGGQCGA
jgi:hypothetical protein